MDKTWEIGWRKNQLHFLSAEEEYLLGEKKSRNSADCRFEISGTLFGKGMDITTVSKLGDAETIRLCRESQKIIHALGLAVVMGRSEVEEEYDLDIDAE